VLSDGTHNVINESTSNVRNRDNLSPITCAHHKTHELPPLLYFLIVVCPHHDKIELQFSYVWVLCADETSLQFFPMNPGLVCIVLVSLTFDYDPLVFTHKDIPEELEYLCSLFREVDYYMFRRLQYFYLGYVLSPLDQWFFHQVLTIELHHIENVNTNNLTLELQLPIFNGVIFYLF
jgi:hypothetical protein